LTRLTFEFNNRAPKWTPDGKRVTYGSSRFGRLSNGLFWAPADGSGPPEPLVEAPESAANSWSPDGKTLVYVQGLERGSDLWTLSLAEGERKARPFLQTPSHERAGPLSPDGRWLAYLSDETGRAEVYVQPFPGRGGKWQVSTDGAFTLRWARSGRELFYRSGNRVMVVDVSSTPTFKAGTPKLLFEGRHAQGPSPGGRPRRPAVSDGQSRRGAVGRPGPGARGDGVVRGAETPRPGGEKAMEIV